MGSGQGLATIGEVDEALGIARESGDPWARVAALASVAPRLTELSQVEAAMAIARSTGDELGRVHALAALLPRLAELGQTDDALANARRIGDDWVLARTLAALGRVDEASAVARDIQHNESRAAALTAVAPRLAALPHTRLSLLWSETLRLLATRSRSDLLSDLASLAPLIPRLGGSEAIAETCTAIEEVGRWWP